MLIDMIKIAGKFSGYYITSRTTFAKRRQLRCKNTGFSEKLQYLPKLRELQRITGALKSEHRKNTGGPLQVGDKF